MRRKKPIKEFPDMKCQLFAIGMVIAAVAASTNATEAG
jgi:hypothetical protein